MLTVYKVAKLLREQISSFLERGSGELPEEKLQRLLHMDASHKVVSYALMNPVLWESLPRELLVLVLARLPVPEITRLRCQLFKEWTMNMKFNRACDEANPNMAALVSYSLAANEFLVRIFNFNNYVWLYGYRFHLTRRRNAPSGNLIFWKPMASDGGLVCFVSTCKYTKANPLCIVVINPLTRVQHELPPLQHVYTIPPTLVHMKVDSKTKAYKVVVVVKQPKGRHTIETYDFVSRQWSKAAPSWGRIWGRACEYKSSHCNYFRLKSARLCAYDFEQGQLELWDCNLLFQSEGACVMQFALAGDRMFVLYKNLNRHDVGSGLYFITEFQSQNNAKVWAPVKTHCQGFFEKEDDLFDLHACEDVLVLRERFYSKKQICCFLNFSTNEWHNLPSNSPEDRHVSRMCRVFWNVNP